MVHKHENVIYLHTSFICLTFLSFSFTVNPSCNMLLMICPYVEMRVFIAMLKDARAVGAQRFGCKLPNFIANIKIYRVLAIHTNKRNHSVGSSKSIFGISCCTWKERTSVFNSTFTLSTFLKAIFSMQLPRQQKKEFHVHFHRKIQSK